MGIRFTIITQRIKWMYARAEARYGLDAGGNVVNGFLMSDRVWAAIIVTTGMAVIFSKVRR